MPITALPTDVLSLVLAQLRLVRDIKKARVCRALRDAAPPELVNFNGVAKEKRLTPPEGSLATAAPGVAGASARCSANASSASFCRSPIILWEAAQSSLSLTSLSAHVAR